MGMFSSDDSIDWYRVVDEYRAKIKKLEAELEAARLVVTALRIYAKRENWVAGSDGKYGAMACDYGHKATKALTEYDEAVK